MNLNVSAYIIFYNNEHTLSDSVNSLLNQTYKIDEIILIDDGSTDNSYDVASRFQLRVIKNKNNCGRGYSRKLAHDSLNGDFILSLDATNILPKTFLEKGLKWFKNPNICALYGRICQRTRNTLSEKWRSVHLFKDNINQEIMFNDTFITYGSIVRNNMYKIIGGYDNDLKFNEDLDLGSRFKKNGFITVFDPSLEVISISNESVFKTLERYSRWYSGYGEKQSLRDYFKNTIYSVRHMVMLDFRLQNYSSIPVSLICPHFQFLFQFIKYSL